MDNERERHGFDRRCGAGRECEFSLAVRVFAKPQGY
jgi:hypothetical protein